jgi:PAS domain S-box-containing protein
MKDEVESKRVEALRRRALELEVEERTSVITVTNAVIRAITETAGDDEAYSAVLEALRSLINAEGGVFRYIEPTGLYPIVATGRREALLPAREEGLAITRLQETQSGAYSGFGLALAFAVARPFMAQDRRELGCVILGRNDRVFEARELKLLDLVCTELRPLIASRTSRMREDYVRREAEKALRRSEERLRAFFEESRDMIYTANKDDVIASINAAGLALLGCGDRFEALGRPFSGFVVNPEDRLGFLERITEAGFVSDYEFMLKRPDGSTVFCLETAHAIRDKTGAFVETQGIIKDITERIKNERDLWKANMELAEANLRLKTTQMLVVQQEKLASIGQLAAGIAHEINNPLGFLKSNHGMLASYSRSFRKAWEEAAALHPESLGSIAAEHDLDYVFTESEVLLAESEEGFRRIMDIVKSLRSFARAGGETGVGPYDLNKGLDSTLVVAWNAIKYVAEVDKDYGDLPEIEADGGAINQVLLNLLVNAAQAIEAQERKGKGRIRVTTKLEGGLVACMIADDGPGVPPERRLRIFDPFFTTKAPGKGTGLGLSISYDIVVNRHAGSIEVDEAPGGGALFTIRLPVKHVARSGNEAAGA